MKTMLAFALVLAAACSKHDTDNPQRAAATPVTAPATSSRVEIAVTEKGFEPGDVQVPAGKPVTLVFDRKTDQTCAKQVVVPMPNGTKIDKQLPLNTPVEVAATFPTAGKITYACGMDMMKATITVQ